MNILAFESSCDETSAAVVRETDGELSVLSNIVASQIDIHRLYGGVVPEIASRAHIEAISNITAEALVGAGVSLEEIDLIAVTSNPGLIGALLVAVNFAKSLAAANDIPLVAVDHIKGHIAANYLVKPAPKPPFVAIVLSGGHTSIYKATSYTDYRILGATRDDAIGEAFDKIGRMIGIPYPAGAGFDKLSRDGFIRLTGKTEDFYTAYRKAKLYREGDIQLPSPALLGETLDFSFSGLKTAAINLLHRYEQLGKEIDREAFAARYTYEAVEAVAKRAREALLQNEGAPLLVAGGVCANSHLRLRLSEIARELGRELYLPPLPLCGDNAAMIGAEGYYEYLAGNFSDASLNASAEDSITE